MVSRGQWVVSGGQWEVSGGLWRAVMVSGWSVVVSGRAGGGQCKFVCAQELVHYYINV